MDKRTKLKMVSGITLAILLITTIFGLAAQKVTLNVIMEEVPDTKKIQSLVPKFEEKYPGIDVKIEAIPYEAMRSKELTQFMAPKSAYDVVIIDNPWMDQFAKAGFLTPLNKFIDKKFNFDDFIKPVRKIGVVGGKIYGIPFYNYAVGLITRKDIFADKELNKAFKSKFGVPLTAPETLKQYERVVLFINNHLKGVYGAAMQGKRGYKIFEESKNLLYANGATVLNKEGKVVLDSPSAVEALKVYVNVIQNAAQPGATNAGFDAAFRTMARGNAATMLSYNWMLPRLNNPENTGEVAGSFALHQVPGKKSVLGAWHWAIPHNAPNKEASWKFIHFMTKPNIAKLRVIRGGAPVRSSVLKDPEVWEKGYGKHYYQTLQKILKNAQPLARTSKAEEIIQAVGTELNKAAVGQESPKEALSAAAKKVRKILKEIPVEKIPGKGKW